MSKPSVRSNTPHFIEMFAFTFPEILLMIILCCVVYPAGLPNFVSFVLFFYLTSEHWLPTIERDPAANIRIATLRQNDHTYIEIGGPQHSDEWMDNLNQSCAQALRTRSVLYNKNAFKIDLFLHCQSRTTLDSLREVVGMLSPPHSGVTCTRSPGLELNVEVIKDSSLLDVDDTAAQHTVDLYRLSNLQKLVWKGSYPHFLFARPQYRTYWDVLLNRATDVKFPQLTELCLIDCNLKAGDLVDILGRCPMLTIFEIRQLECKPDPAPMSSDSDDETNQLAAEDNATDIVVHRNLKHLAISSVIDLREFFCEVRLPNLQSLLLHISRWTPLPCPIEDYVPLLQFDWTPLAYFELAAPLNYYSVHFLKAFFGHRPSLLSRTHSLVDDRSS